MNVRYTGDRISVSEAAEMLGMGEQQLRVQMRNGKLDIGSVCRSKNGVCSYYVYKVKVLKVLGRE